jgi:hypothetical protein
MLVIDCHFSPGPLIAENIRLRSENNFFLSDQLIGRLLENNVMVFRSPIWHCESDTGGPTAGQGH